MYIALYTCPKSSRLRNYHRRGAETRAIKSYFVVGHSQMRANV